MKKLKLSNDVSLIIKNNPKTPRVACVLFFEIKNKDVKPGVYTLLKRLFLQGTKTRSAEALAEELEQNAIDCYCNAQNDYIRFSTLCLNENFEKSIDILSDIVKNSTFENFDKEVYKTKGEFEADLDSPKTSAFDNFTKTIYAEHFYGNSYTKILESIDSITKEDIIDAYEYLLEFSHKTVVVVGDIPEDVIIQTFENKFGFLKNSDLSQNPETSMILNEKQVVTIAKEDAQQAQIIQGWLVPSLYSSEYPAFILLDNILGSSGLSSRLFLELRDKKGLAYTVRSFYDSYKEGANFAVYIGTEPSNIKTALDGFKFEIERLKNELVSDEELENAKNNIIGKRLFYKETNFNQALLLGKLEMTGKGYEFEEQLISQIKGVTKEDVQNVAKNYLDEDYVLSVLAPSSYLEQIRG